MHDEVQGVPPRRQRQPIFRAPKVVTVLLALLILIYTAYAFLPEEQQSLLIDVFGLFPSRISGALRQLPRLDIATLPSLLWPLVTHTFLHGGLLHIGFNALWLLALGTPVAQRLGASRFLGLYFVCGILGALFYVFLRPDSPIPVIGASGAISGLMGGVVRFALVPSRSGKLVSLGDARLLVFVGLWFIINLVFGVTGFGVTDEAMAIAWEAHVGGFVGGLVLFPLFDRARLPSRSMDDRWPTV